MSKSLQFLMKRSIINSFKNILKKPLKSIGMFLAFVYFLFLPFIMMNMISDFGFNTPSGFVIISTVTTLYLITPTTLSYFKRKGVIFKKQDIHFILSAPTSPKQALIYALLKQAPLNLIMQISVGIAAYFVFNINLLTTLIYLFVSLVFSNLLSYSLAIIMYASESITLKQKTWIRNSVYLMLLLFTLALLSQVIPRVLASGFQLDYLVTLLTHPLVLLLPIFGWQLGWLNLIILGMNPVNLIASLLFFTSSIALAYYAYTMPCQGEYYEDALSFSENMAIIESKGGDHTFAEAFGIKKKTHASKGKLQGKYGQVIFFKQVMERRKTHRFFLSLGDLVYLLGGIGIGVFHYFVDDVIDPAYFFQIMIGISLYLALFFNPKETWRNEFSSYYLFLIPDKFMTKLLYASSLEHLMSLIRSLLLTIPAGVLLGASFLQIFYAIVAQTILKAMMTYVAIFIRGVLAAKIGKMPAQFVSVLVSFTIVIIPVIILVVSFALGNLASFLMILLYSSLMMVLFLYLSSRFLTNIETLNA